MLQFVLTFVGAIVLSGTAVTARGTWLGAFGHDATAYNDSPPTATVGRDGKIRALQAGYAPLPLYNAETTVREIVRLGAAARSIRIRFSNEFYTRPYA
jgi:hypothetical protein